MEAMLHKGLLHHLMKLREGDKIDIAKLNIATNIVDSISSKFNGNMAEIFFANSQVLSTVCAELYSFAKCPLHKEGGYFHDVDFVVQCKKVTETMRFYKSVSDLYKAVKVSDSCYGDENSCIGHSLLVYSVLLSSEHVDISHEWSNEDCVAGAQQLQKALCQLYSCNSLTNLLTLQYKGEHSFYYIMEEIKQCTKEHGVKSIGVLTAFTHLLCHYDAPLSPYLHVVFATCFILIDDHQVCNKVNGVICLQHVLSHTTAAEMSLYGRCDVIYSALYNMLYCNDVSLIKVLLPTILHVIKVESGTPVWANTFKGECPKLNNVLQIILRNMEMENSLSMRRVYSEYLNVYIMALGIEAVQHYKRLFSVLYSYMEIHDGDKEQSRIHTLAALESLITHTWPRIPKYSSSIMKNLLKLVVDITDGSVTIETTAVKAILEGCSGCIKLLYLLEPEPVTKTIQALVEAEIPRTTMEFCKKQLVLHSQQC